MQRVEQLSFDVFPNGKPPREKREGPEALTLSVSGKFRPRDAMPPGGDERLPELYHGEYVTVQILSADGEVIAAGHGKVQIGFKDKIDRTTEEEITIREQKIKLDG